MNYEEIRMIQRKEKSVSELVEVGDAFYKDLSGFVKQSLDNSDSRTLDNVIKLSRDVFEKREQKILLKALRCSHTGDQPTHLSKEEKVFFDSVLQAIKCNRDFFDKVVVGDYEFNGKCEEDTLIKDNNENIVLVRPRTEIPRFVGSDSLEYGPFKANEVVKLPRKEADLLFKQNLVEVM